MEKNELENNHHYLSASNIFRANTLEFDRQKIDQANLSLDEKVGLILDLLDTLKIGVADYMLRDSLKPYFAVKGDKNV